MRHVLGRAGECRSWLGPPSLTGRVLIAGTTAAPGTLVFSPGRITGRLSGHRVRLTALPMAAPASVFGSDSAQTRAARVIP